MKARKSLFAECADCIGGELLSLLIITAKNRLKSEFGVKGRAKVRSALSDIKQAINSKQLDLFHLGNAYRWLGKIKEEEKDFISALDFYSQAIKFDSSGYHLFYARGNCLKELGQREKACADYRRAVDLGYVKAYDVIKSYCN